MNETISKVEKTDVEAPVIEAGGTVIVFQRHEKYDRSKGVDTTGSIMAFPEDVEDTRERDREFFREVLGNESDGETMVLFIGSPTQYAGGGHRSMETAQLAADAAIEIMEEMGISPSERIINFNEQFSTGKFDKTGQDIRPMKGIEEPRMFDQNMDFVEELGRQFNSDKTKEDIEARRTDVKLDPQAFGAYEEDAPGVKELREQFGKDGKPVEGVYDILDRTNMSLRALERYARLFHAKNPGKKLVIWAASHYDTISPLVKDATGQSFDTYVPVDYGAGVVIEIAPGGKEDPILKTKHGQVALSLGRNASKGIAA